MSNENLRKFLTAFSISLFGLSLLYLGGTGKLGVYIHPSSQWLVLFAGAILLLLLLENIFKQRSTLLDYSTSIGILCLLGVALSLFFLKPTPLSVETARLRISTNQDSVSTKHPDRFMTRKTTEFSIIDWLAAFSDNERIYRYDGAPADLSGFLMFQDDQTLIARLIITCCGADAQPATIEFDWSGELPTENSWIRIVGTMHAVNGKPQLEAKSIESISEPKNPYAE